MPYRNDFRGPHGPSPRYGYGPGPGRGPGGGFPIWVLFAPFLFLIFFSLDAAPIGFSLAPIFLILIIAVAIILAIKSSLKTTAKSSSSTSNSTNYSSSSKVEGNIDDKLKRYFSNNNDLAIIDGINLTTINGTYEDVSSLMITSNGEKVCTLEEFKESYPDLYKTIYSLLTEFSRQKDVTPKKETKKDSDVKKTETTKTSTMSEDDQKLKIFVDKINKLNGEIPNEEITNGLYKTTDLLTQIIKFDDDKVDGKVSKLYDYYLPILVSILEKYKKLQNGAQNDEFIKCQTQLNKTIILINEALKTIIDNVNEKEIDDINADMTTLQSLLSKDGYSKDPFKK